MSEHYCVRCQDLILDFAVFEACRDGAIPLGELSQWQTDCSSCVALGRLAGVDLAEARDALENDDLDEDDESLAATVDLQESSEQEYCIWPFNTSTVFADPPSPCLLDWEQPLAFAVLETQIAHEGSSEKIFNCIRGRGWLSQLSESGSRQPHSARQCGQLADVALAKSWIGHCISKHAQCRSVMERPNAMIKLVDCRTRKVVPRDKEQPYISLSYVYAAAPDLGYKDGELVVNQPEMIENALELTMALNYDYLWIDRYCINQADKLEKAAQIQQMDQIYARSDLTLIATDTAASLPGVRSRLPLTTLEFGPMSYLVMPSTPRYEIENSRWSDRAWCYQESILSRRRLVVLADQLYFKCINMHCCESMNGLLGKEETNAEPRQQWQRWEESEVFISLSAQECPLAHVLNHIAEYSKRHLSYSGDILNGITGVLAQMRLLYPDLICLSGLPLLASGRDKGPLKAILLAALCWKTAFPAVKRRDEFPSWSWCGWYQALPFVENDEPGVLDCFAVDISLIRDNNEVLSLEGFEHLIMSTDLWQTSAKSLEVIAPIIEIKFDRWIYENPEDVLPHGKAVFKLPISSQTIHARFFPPTYAHDDIAEPAPWYAILFGRREPSTRTGNSGMLVALVTKELEDGSMERIGIIELDASEPSTEHGLSPWVTLSRRHVTVR